MSNNKLTNDLLFTNDLRINLKLKLHNFLKNDKYDWGENRNELGVQCQVDNTGNDLVSFYNMFTSDAVVEMLIIDTIINNELQN